MSRSGPPPLRRLVVPGLFVAALFVVSFLRQAPDPAALHELVISGSTMGTTFNVKVVTDDVSEPNRARLTKIMRGEVDGVDETMSTYRAESEIELFNNGGAEVFAASHDLLEVVAEAQRVARLSNGAFDITVGPLVDLWGFGPSGETATPGEDELRQLMATTGYEQLEVDFESGTLRKARPEIRIDLSAIAKGFAVDQLSAALTREGLADHLVEVGGEVRARGANGSGETWRIGIERPTAVVRSLHMAVALADASLATSGDYRNYFERGGVRFSHTIDPRTGRPITHNLASVSVIQPNCMSADALATALEVLGPEEGYEMAERLGIPALFLVRTVGDAFEQSQTTAWAALVENSVVDSSVD